MKPGKVEPLATDRVVAAINQWLADRPDAFAAGEIAGVYSLAEWAERGEDHGNTASVTLLLNEGGEFYNLVNLNRPGEDGDALYEQFSDLLACHGYMHELGYSWSLHLYPRDA